MNMPILSCRVCGGDPCLDKAFRSRDGLICRECQSKSDKKRYHLRKSQGIKVSGPQASKEWQKNYKKVYSQLPYVKKHRSRYARERLNCPIEAAKYKTRQMCRNAIRRGELVKNPCEVCGNKKVDAHHDDYTKPLMVRWLCRQHHSDFHHETRRQARGEVKS